MVTWCINWRRSVGSNNFSAQFIKIICHYKKIGDNINASQQTACLVVNPIMVGNFARLFICALWSPAGKGLPFWLSFVVSNCEFVTFPLVSCVKCGTWLYRFLIFAPLLSLLSSLIARLWVGLQTLWRFRLKDLSIDGMVGAWCFGWLSGRPGFTCWISFAPVVQFYLLLSPYLCFIFLLYLHLYVLGDDALIS